MITHKKISEIKREPVPILTQGYDTNGFVIA